MSWYIAFMAIELYPGTRVISLAEIFAVHCTTVGLPFWLSWWRIRWQWGRPGFDPWVGNIPWRRERLPTPVFWPGEFHGLYSPWGRKESDTTEWLSIMRIFRCIASCQLFTWKGKQENCLIELEGKSLVTTPVFLPGKIPWTEELVGWATGHGVTKESDTTEWLNNNKQQVM